MAIVEALDAGVFGFIAMRRLPAAGDRGAGHARAGRHIACFLPVAKSSIVAMSIEQAGYAAVAGFIASLPRARIPVAHALSADATVALGAEIAVVAWIDVVEMLASA